MTMPTEEDLVNALRSMAERNNGLLPATLGMGEGDVVFMTVTVPKIDMDQLGEQLKEVLEKFGGKKKLKEQYQKDKKLPPEIMNELMKAGGPMLQKQMQEQLPIIQQQAQGLTFFEMLGPENDPHYVGGGVKLGTPDRPVLWYKPTGSDTYRVIYADLSVEDMTPEDAKRLPKGKPQ
jgi:hypothetical protein